LCRLFASSGALAYRAICRLQPGSGASAAVAPQACAGPVDALRVDADLALGQDIGLAPERVDVAGDRFEGAVGFEVILRGVGRSEHAILCVCGRAVGEDVLRADLTTCADGIPDEYGAAGIIGEKAREIAELQCAAADLTAGRGTAGPLP